MIQQGCTIVHTMPGAFGLVAMGNSTAEWTNYKNPTPEPDGEMIWRSPPTTITAIAKQNYTLLIVAALLMGQFDARAVTCQKI